MAKKTEAQRLEESQYYVMSGDEAGDHYEFFPSRGLAQAAFDKIVAGPAEIVGYPQIVKLYGPVGAGGREQIAKWSPGEDE